MLKVRVRKLVFGDFSICLPTKVGISHFKKIKFLSYF